MVPTWFPEYTWFPGREESRHTWIFKILFLAFGIIMPSLFSTSNSYIANICILLFVFIIKIHNSSVIENTVWIPEIPPSGLYSQHTCHQLGTQIEGDSEYLMWIKELGPTHMSLSGSTEGCNSHQEKREPNWVKLILHYLLILSTI